MTGPADDEQRVPEAPGAADSSAWAPLRYETFRWLWVGVLVSGVGTYMQTVGAQWLLVDRPDAAALVSLVQVANTVPVMLLALPAGVLADSFDRRRLLLVVQFWFLVVGVALAALTLTGLVPPAVLLVFTFALGVGTAVQLPAWQALIPDLVPRPALRPAARLDLVSVNLARSVGPAVAGGVIAASGGSAVFLLNALSVVPLGLALAGWRGLPAVDRTAGRERFVPALRAGGRYVWHEPVVRLILARVALFVAPGMALWALLPVIATRQLRLGAGGYGGLFAALGAGAVVGALVLPRAKDRLSTTSLLAVAAVLYAAATAVVVLTSAAPAAIAALLVAGTAWMATTSTLVAELQLFMPAWVRARGMGLYTVVFTGSQAAGALVWGLLAEQAGLHAAVLLAALLVAVGGAAGYRWRVPEVAHLDPAPAVYWAEARLALEPAPKTGPVLVTVEYTVDPDREAAFLEAMTRLRRSRRRTGATRWELYRDAARPDRFVESFRVPTWEEHLRQHEGRLTAVDREVEEAVHAVSDPPPRAEHLLPP